MWTRITNKITNDAHIWEPFFSTNSPAFNRAFELTPHIALSLLAARRNCGWTETSASNKTRERQRASPGSFLRSSSYFIRTETSAVGRESLPDFRVTWSFQIEPEMLLALRWWTERVLPDVLFRIYCCEFWRTGFENEERKQFLMSICTKKLKFLFKFTLKRFNRNYMVSTDADCSSKNECLGYIYFLFVLTSSLKRQIYLWLSFVFLFIVYRKSINVVSRILW